MIAYMKSEMWGKKPRMVGEAIRGNIKCTFIVRPTSKDGYEFELVVNLISPGTGKILQATTKKRPLKKRLTNQIAQLKEELADPELPEGEKEDLEDSLAAKQNKLKALNRGQRLDALNATTLTYLHDDKKDTIEAAVEQKFFELYCEHAEQIAKELGQAPETGDLHARTAHDLYSNNFFRSRPAVTEAVLAEQKRALKVFCDLLEKPIGALTSADIKRAVSKLTKSQAKRMKLFEDFFTYAGENHAYRGPNPITRYLMETPAKKAKKRNGRRAVMFLSTKVDRALHTLILEQLGTAMCLAPVLVKGFRITMERLLTITWADVIFLDDVVLLQDYHEAYTGGTHNYLRPPLREAQMIIRAHYEHLREKYSEKQLRTQLLVPVPGNSVKEKKAALSRYFQTILRKASLSAEDIKSAADPDHPTAAGGAGFALLSYHYDYILEKVCGVDLNSGEGCYLRGMRIHDTTTDYYRCLSDPTGNYHLSVIVNRDGYAEPGGDVPLEELRTTVDAEQNMTTVTAASAGALERAGLLSTKAIRVPAGSMVTLSGGILGAVRFQNDGETDLHPRDSTEMSYVKLY